MGRLEHISFSILLAAFFFAKEIKLSLEYKYQSTAASYEAAHSGFEMNKIPQNVVLILIDIQQGFDYPKWGALNNPDAESKPAQLLEHDAETIHSVSLATLHDEFATITNTQAILQFT